MTCGPHLGFSWASIRRMTSSIHSIRSRTMLKKRNLSPVSTSFTRRPSAASSRFFQASRTWEGRDDRQFRTNRRPRSFTWFHSDDHLVWGLISSDHSIEKHLRADWSQTWLISQWFHQFVVVFETCFIFIVFLFSGLVVFLCLSLCRRHHRLHSVFVTIVQSVARVQVLYWSKTARGQKEMGHKQIKSTHSNRGKSIQYVRGGQHDNRLFIVRRSLRLHVNLVLMKVSKSHFITSTVCRSGAGF